jgi:hypothetical protein
MKLFTVEEANALLPELRRLLARVRRQREVLGRLEPEARRAGERAEEGGGLASGSRYAQALNLVMEDAQAIAGLGIQIKDFDRGLCDFPHLRGGRVVLLCWQRGEDRVAWWHEVEAGFAGRQPL